MPRPAAAARHAGLVLREPASFPTSRRAPTTRNADYLQLVDAAIEGDDTFEHKREVIDEYGWRHFGDIYGDHEAVFHKGPGR